MKLLRIAIFSLFIFIGIALHAWAALALYYCIFLDMYIVTPVIYILLVVNFIIFHPKHMKAFLLSLLGFVIVALWFTSIQPKRGGVYPPELALPYAEFNGEDVTIHNVRNSHYRSSTDFDVRRETRTYNIKDIRTLDLFVNYWGMEAIAHTLLSFGFDNGDYVAVSVENRRKIGKKYDMVQGFFKQYTLIYVWGDERDLVRLRTNYRKEDVYLYRVAFTPDKVRKMFVSMLKSTNEIYQHPRFYNTLTQSCTNTLGDHIIATGAAELPLWKRRFRTGDVDRRLYKERLLITNGLSFAELRQRANINSRAEASDRDPNFSKKIRTHLGTMDVRRRNDGQLTRDD